MRFPTYLTCRAALLLGFAALLGAGCDANPAGVLAPDATRPNAIDFSSLEIGQQSRYLYFTGENFYSPEATGFAYTADTLVVTVIDRTAEGFIFHERLAPGSASLQTEAPLIPPDAPPLRYRVRIDGDLLRRESLDGTFFASQLFGYYTQPLELAPVAGPKAVVQGWKTSASACACYREAFVENYTQLGQTYPRLNLLVDERDMQVDGPGYAFLYDRQAGLVRSTVINPWTGSGFGWDVLPHQSTAR